MIQMQNEHWESVFNTIDHYLRVGRFDLAYELLNRIKPKEIPRTHKASFTHLYRRCGMNYKGLRVLQKIVRPEEGQGAIATQEEVTAYASCLTNVGSYHESIDLLNNFKEGIGGELLLFKAFAQIAQWKYGTAANLLKRYIHGISKTEYSYWVGVTNYCASMIAEDKGEEVLELLHELIVESEIQGWNLLNGNAQMLLAQYFIQISSFDKAEKVLYQPEENLNRMKLYGGLIKKWQTILKLKSTASHSAIEGAKAYRLSAQKTNFWEGVRDIDYYLSIAEKNPRRFYKVYYGTPYESYHRRIKKDLPFEFNPEPQILIESSQDLNLNEPITEIVQFPKLVRDPFLQALILDLYMPIREGQLHSLLFPKEYYNSFSSPHRVQQALFRFRNKLKESNSGLTVIVKSRSFKLHSHQALNLPRTFFSDQRGSQVPNWIEIVIPRLTKTVTIAQMVQALKKSDRTCQRLMKAAIDNGYFIKIGKGKSSFYQLTRKRK